MKTFKHLFAAAAVAATLLMMSCSKGATGSGEEKAGKPEDVPAEVTVTQVVLGDITELLAVSGNIAAPPNQDVKIASLVPGRVAKINVAEGDHVTAGQVLATLESGPLEDQVKQADAAVEQAKANVQNAKYSLERNETLFNKGIAARKEVEDARTQMIIQEGGFRQAEAALSVARAQVSRARVVSPLNGIVVKRFLSIGEQADGTAAQPILEVANLEEVELQGNVPALYLAKVKQGQNFEVKAEQYAAKPLAATVVAISPSVDPGSDIGMVRIRIANSLHVLRLGMFLTVQLPIQTQMNTLYVPAQAVYRGQSGETHVYRVKGDAVEEIAVRLGVQTLDRVEILSGVQAGDTIVLEGGYGLADHAKVKTKP